MAEVDQEAVLIAENETEDPVVDVKPATSASALSELFKAPLTTATKPSSKPKKLNEDCACANN
jgi:hypothetical protein